MTWVTNNNFAIKMAAAFQNDMYSFNYALWGASNASLNYINIYKGTMPLTNVSKANLTNYSSDLLCQFNNYYLARSNATIQMGANPNPSVVTATGTGTATWFAMWCNQAAHYGTLIGDVSTNGGTGAMFLSTTNITSGNSVTFVNFSFTCLGVP